MKYHLKIYYRTPLMDKITGYMQQIVPEWKQNDRRLEGCRVFEFETATPLSNEVKRKLVALKQDWMEDVVLEEASDGS